MRLFDAIADKQAAARIEDDRMRLVELARAGALLAPLLDELAVLAELHDAVVHVAVGDEDVAVGSDGDVARRR